MLYKSNDIKTEKYEDSNYVKLRRNIKKTTGNIKTTTVLTNLHFMIETYIKDDETAHL